MTPTESGGSSPPRFSPGGAIVLDIDRLSKASEVATSEEAQELMDTIVGHEFGYHLGLGHKGKGRTNRDLMHEEKGLKTRDRQNLIDDDKEEIRKVLQ